MQVVPEKDQLRRAIHQAFDSVPVPSRVDDMIFARYQGSDDPYMMAAELAGQAWQNIPIDRLFFHRESLGMLSASAYRAYLPAYLLACLASDDVFDKYGADLRSYTLSTLKAWPHHNEEHRALVTERLSLLDAEQRAAVAGVVRFLASQWQMKDAAEVLAEW